MSCSAADVPGAVGSDPGRTWVVPGYTEVRQLGRGGLGEVVLRRPASSGQSLTWWHSDKDRTVRRALRKISSFTL
jgi:hypothetical protein